MFWYGAFPPELTKKGTPVVNDNGSPKWRMAPSPKGPYWEEGMKLGYQDAGAWTFLKSTPREKRMAAWLYAQFVVSKTVSLKKTLVGLTPIRESDINSETLTKVSPMLGGLVEFYRSPARREWTPTGANVPDYPALSNLWWQYIADAASKDSTPQKALDGLAKAQDNVLKKLEKENRQGVCGPKLNAERGPGYWLAQPGSPKAKLANEKPQGKTVAYDSLLKSWGLYLESF